MRIQTKNTRCQTDKVKNFMDFGFGLMAIGKLSKSAKI